MLFEVTTALLILLLPCFFLFGFYFGQRGNAPLLPSKPKQKEPDRLEILARNIANYSGDSSNQEKIS